MAWKTGQQQEGGSGGVTQQQTRESLCPLTCAFNVQPGNLLGWEQFLKIEEQTEKSAVCSYVRLTSERRCGLAFCKTRIQERGMRDDSGKF